ncbi:MAG TPA: hypothetical protein VLK84_18735 [Longimicrobium sp.]|nr:hypothetical protein [Longimicrobium sp.]
MAPVDAPVAASTTEPVAAPVTYRPAPSRPPEEPKGFRWGTALAWVVLVVGGVLVATFFYRLSNEIDQGAVAEEEMAREREHLRTVLAWMRDTTATTPAPGSAVRAAPTSDRAKRLWVINRILVDRHAWEREVMTRHGARGHTPPAPWGTAPYQARARAYPEVGTYLEGRVAAIAEIDRTSAAWLQERTAALARESGISAGEIRGILPAGFGAVAPAQAPLADAMLQMHRQFVRMDPRVRHAGGTELLYEREEDIRRVQELVARHNEAMKGWNQAEMKRTSQEVAVLNQWIQ